MHDTDADEEADADGETEEEEVRAVFAPPWVTPPSSGSFRFEDGD